MRGGSWETADGRVAHTSALPVKDRQVHSNISQWEGRGSGPAGTCYLGNRKQNAGIKSRRKPCLSP